jgi:hypothetical protein
MSQQLDDDCFWKVMKGRLRSRHRLGETSHPSGIQLSSHPAFSDLPRTNAHSLEHDEKPVTSKEHVNRTAIPQRPPLQVFLHQTKPALLCQFLTKAATHHYLQNQDSRCSLPASILRKSRQLSNILDDSPQNN